MPPEVWLINTHWTQSAARKPITSKGKGRQVKSCRPFAAAPYSAPSAA